MSKDWITSNARRSLYLGVDNVYKTHATMTNSNHIKDEAIYQLTGEQLKNLLNIQKSLDESTFPDCSQYEQKDGRQEYEMELPIGEKWDSDSIKAFLDKPLSISPSPADQKTAEEQYGKIEEIIDDVLSSIESRLEVVCYGNGKHKIDMYCDEERKTLIKAMHEFSRQPRKIVWPTTSQIADWQKTLPQIPNVYDFGLLLNYTSWLMSEFDRLNGLGGEIREGDEE